MVDEKVPTTQFHPYQKPDATPQSERPTATGLRGMLSKAGLDRTGNVDLQGGVNKVRNYANANPGKVLGGLAALVIGAGMLSRRSGVRR